MSRAKSAERGLEPDGEHPPLHSSCELRIPARPGGSPVTTEPRLRSSRGSEKLAGSASSATSQTERRKESHWQQRKMRRCALRFVAGIEPWRGLEPRTSWAQAQEFWAGFLRA